MYLCDLIKNVRTISVLYGAEIYSIQQSQRMNEQLLKNTILLCALMFFWGALLQGQTRLEIKFSKEAGKYNNAVRLTLESEIGAAIHYTLNGSEPTRSSAKYNTPLIINKTTVIRAIAYKNAKASSVYTRTYLLNEETKFMIVSVVVEPNILNNPQTGWLHKGPNADSAYPYLGANYWNRREVSANAEFFEADGQQVFGSRVGLKLFGGMSRTFAQKSFTISARDIYGDKRIEYQIFPNEKQKKYKHLVIRNAGSDCEKAHFRDAFMTSLLDGVDIEKQSYRPILYFVNGEYWGIYFLRDKVNRYFVDYAGEADRDSIDLIEHKDRVKSGSLRHYNKMLAYMSKNDLNDEKHFEYINTQMDINNFMTLQVAQIYFDNQDAGGNIKFWRPKTPEGRWRWVLYDTDWGFGLQDSKAYQFNTLQLQTAADSEVWPNPAWSTFILRSLLKNKTFEAGFVNRFADYMNSYFEPNRVESKIDSFEQMLLPEINRHINRWGYSKQVWRANINVMHTFAKERPKYMIGFLQEKFDIGAARTFELTVTQGGKVLINNNITVEKQLKGKYFEKVPITLKALPDYGNQFLHWELPDGKKSEDAIVFVLKKDLNKVKAVFKDSNHPMDGRVVINEISPNNKTSGDWIELYNLSEEVIKLSGWVLRDANHGFRIEKGVIPAKGYLILSEDTASFKAAFPLVKNIIGNFDFGISKKKEQIRLFASNGALIDSVNYELEKVDSVFTLSLVFPTMENGDQHNWSIITSTGTPGAPNPGYEQKLKAIQQKKYWWMGGSFLLVVTVLGIFVWRRKKTTKV